MTAAAQDCCLTSSLDRMYSVGRQHRRPTTVAQVTVVPVLFTLDQCVWFVKKVVGVVSAETRGSLGRSGRGRGSWSLESRGWAASPLSTSQGLWERCKLRSGDWGKPTAAQSFSGILLLRETRINILYITSILPKSTLRPAFSVTSDGVDLNQWRVKPPTPW